MYILLTFLFLLDVILSVQSTKNSICDSKKAHDVAILACPTRNQIITRITFASFGNPRGDCYSKTLSEDPTCRSEHALEVAESFCVGRSECRVPVMYSLFGETTNCNSEHSLTLKAECGPLSESPESRPMKLKPYEILLVVDGVERKLSFTFHESTSYFDLQNTASNFLENEFGMSHTSVDIVDAVVKQMHVGAYETMGQEIIGNLILGSPQDGTYYEDAFVTVSMSLSLSPKRAKGISETSEWHEIMPDVCTNRYECAAQMCFDLVSASDESVILKHECNELHHSVWTVDELDPGKYIMRAWLELGDNHRALTAPTLSRFEIRYEGDGMRRRKASHATHFELSESEKWPFLVDGSENKDHEKEIVDLVVGIKSSAAHFEHRRVIRETWGSLFSDESSVLRSRARLFFLVGKPQERGSDQEIIGMRNALEMERSQYGKDILLGDELDNVVDSFATITAKGASFMTKMNREYKFDHLVLLDDDVYLRPKRLYEYLRNSSTPKRRLYAGQVWAVEKKRMIRPVRDPKNKYYVSEESYPMRELFPFVNGPAMIFSHDFVKYIVRSRSFLRPLNNEDLTYGFWAIAAGVTPTHLDTFFDARTIDVHRSGTCREDFISIAELTPSGIREMYSFDLDGNGTSCEMFFEHRSQIVHNHVHSYSRSVNKGDN